MSEFHRFKPFVSSWQGVQSANSKSNHFDISKQKWEKLSCILKWQLHNNTHYTVVQEMKHSYKMQH